VRVPNFPVIPNHQKIAKSNILVSLSEIYILTLTPTTSLK